MYYIEAAVTALESAGGQDVGIGLNAKLVKSSATNTYLSSDRTNITGSTLNHEGTLKLHWCGNLSSGDVIQLRVWGRRLGVAHVIKYAHIMAQKF